MLNGKIVLREGSEEFNKIKQEWYDKARHMKIEDLEPFIKSLTEDYIHDYGTICHAMSIGSIATMWAMDHSENGGITGFQAGCIMWENIKNWMPEYKDVPLKLVNYNDMLYPQYESKYQKVLSDDTFEWLKEQATKNLNEREVAHPDVITHWQTIADGVVPFGYVLQSVVDAEEEREKNKNAKILAERQSLIDSGEIIEFDDGSSGVCTSEKSVEPKVVFIFDDVKDLAVGTFGYATDEILMNPDVRPE